MSSAAFFRRLPVACGNISNSTVQCVV